MIIDMVLLVGASIFAMLVALVDHNRIVVLGQQGTQNESLDEFLASRRCHIVEGNTK